MSTFFVTGMPRSRTAWMAAWLTTDNTFCFHDVMTRPHLDLSGPGSCKYVGYSGPEVCLEARKYSGIPCVTIHRSKEQALASFLKIVKQHPEVKLTEKEIAQWWDERETLLGGLPGKHVSFDLLNNESTMRNLWNYLMPGIPFDAARYRLMNSFNITQDTRKVTTWPLAQ